MWKETLKNPLTFAALSFVFGAASGFVGGVIVTKSTAEKKYSALADEEISSVKKHYVVINEKPEIDEVVAKATASEIIKQSRYFPDDEPVEDDPKPVVEEVIDNTIWSDSQPDDWESWDYEEEVLKRTPDEPYIISKDEFFQNEFDYDQSTLTWYDEDEVLCDDKDVPIDDTNGLVGDDSLLRFGHGSGDRNVVYVRNDRLKLEAEILFSNGGYAKEVLGFIEHSDKTGLRKFRSWDD